MKLAKGDMWSAYDEADWFCITTNATINKNGELVMGRGIALEAKTRFPELARRLGDIFTSVADMLPNCWYGLILVDNIVAFQTKVDWKNQSDLDLIKFSTGLLAEMATEHLNEQFHLNFPGIGNGGLKREDVLPIIQDLPDNVTVWEYE